MTELPSALVELIASGPMAHLTTINADGSPQVTVIWIGLEDGQIVSAHLRHQRKHRNIERDPRVVLSFDGPRDHGAVLSPYAVLHAHATVKPSDEAWNLLNRFTKVYMSPDDEFPMPPRPGYVIQYSVDRISGVGPWVPGSH